MMWSSLKAAFWLLSCILLTSAYTTNYFSDGDKTRLQEVFDAALATKELGNVHYAVIGYKEIKAALPKTADICKFLLESVAGSPSIESYYYASVAWKSIGNCAGSFPSTAAAKVATDTVNNDASTMVNLFHAVFALKSLNQPIPNAAKLSKNLLAILKKDDSVSNLAHSFHIASQLGKDGAFAFDLIEDAIVQADEVDTKYLQFEGGLSITALVVSGVYNVAASNGKAPKVTKDQAAKFAAYFLSRRSVQTAKGAYSLANILNMYATNKYHIPIVATAVDGGRVNRADGKLSVRLTDVLGNPLTPAPSVVLESATRISDGLAIASKVKFTQSAQDKSLYAVGILESKPDAGVYQAKLAVSGGDARLVGTAFTVIARIMATASLESVKIAKADSDLSTLPRYEVISFPDGKLPSKLELDSMQKLLLRFNIKDKGTGKPLSVHQAFVRFSEEKSNREAVFLAETDTTVGTYKLDLDVGSKSADFGRVSGDFRMELIVGDVAVSNPISWYLGDVSLRLGSSSPPEKDSLHPIYRPKPIIQHLFREPEKRPPAVVSNLFTGLVLLPLLILVIIWWKLGINLNNFPISLSCVGFHMGLGGIFCLFGLFWLRLNMFETLKYLSALAPVTFLCGVKTLSKVASQKKMTKL